MFEFILIQLLFFKYSIGFYYVVWVELYFLESVFFVCCLIESYFFQGLEISGYFGCYYNYIEKGIFKVLVFLFR